MTSEELKIGLLILSKYDLHPSIAFDPDHFRTNRTALNNLFKKLKVAVRGNLNYNDSILYLNVTITV